MLRWAASWPGRTTWRTRPTSAWARSSSSPTEADPKLGSFEIIEHTADVGIRARGTTLEEAFEQTALGLLDIAGAWQPGGGETIDVTLEGPDAGALLVDWLNEILYIHETRDAVITSIDVTEVTQDAVRGVVGIAPRAADTGGTAVKAATFHRLSVRAEDGGWATQVYVDV